MDDFRELRAKAQKCTAALDYLHITGYLQGTQSTVCLFKVLQNLTIREDMHQKGLASVARDQNQIS